MRVVMVFLLLGAMLAPGQVAAQQPFEQCGDITLVFRNPDLQRQNDGLVHASGNFFAQFQAIGEDADQIETFGFSFGPVESLITEESALCDQPPQLWFTGAYVLNYRADTNPDDGFFINLQTALVPDGRYTAAVHAYDAADNELARAWTNAVVDNCDAPGPVPPARCDGDAAQNTRNDGTAPWPIMLPGDGDLAAVDEAPADATLTIEFAEELSSLQVFVNGADITDQLQTWDGRLWDDDLRPGYGPYGLAAIIAPECEGPSVPQVNECNPLGVAYYYTGPVTEADVVRVEAADLNGNIAKKELHLGSGVTGAITSDQPILQITVDTLSHTINAGEAAVFQFTIVNSGGGTGHPIKTATGPEGWDVTWTAHDPVEPGETSVQELTALPPAGTPVGVYEVNATITWAQGSGTDSQDWTLRVNVGDIPEGGAGGGGAGAGGETDGDEDGGAKKSPGAPLVVFVMALAAIAVARRRHD